MGFPFLTAWTKASHVISNLLRNAIKCTDNEGEISFHVEKGTQQVIVSGKG
jgi:signal transduction histidine kinase